MQLPAGNEKVKKKNNGYRIIFSVTRKRQKYAKMLDLRKRVTCTKVDIVLEKAIASCYLIVSRQTCMMLFQ